MKPYLSVVIPVKDEAQSLPHLWNRLALVLKNLGKTYEVIFVDDGSLDGSGRVLDTLVRRHKEVTVIEFQGNFGKSAALQAGFDAAHGEVIVTLDADLQDEPTELPKLLRKLDEGYDLVSGWKKERHDPLGKVIPSRVFNAITALLTGVRLHDFNSGFKAYRKVVVEQFELYGELHRFIPVFAAANRFCVTEVAVQHNPRKFGTTKYGIERVLRGFFDLITVVFLTGYLRRPGHFFGGIGLLFFLIGLVINGYITFIRLTTGSIQYRYPLLFLGILCIIVGVQFISTGLLAEMLTHLGAEQKKPYVVRKVIKKS
ncbi:glycosyltransferase family 2 protein [Candidatus Berkelbacteria bacterium]|nr:glycosyltransferase family 2 protein [Candidatus Berkelbacteria bacterium]